MANATIKQHEPIRVPSGWDGQSKMLIIQINRVFDDIYRQLGLIEQRLAELENGNEE